MKPTGWPKYMIEKRLKSGATAYYWNPPARDLANGFPLHREALGPDYGAAIERAKLLNEHLNAWRSGRGVVPNEQARRGYGTVAWLFEQYRRSRAFEKRVSKRSRYEYARALNRIEDIKTKTGRLVADLPVSSMTPAAVDKIYEKLQDGPRGKRVRQANLSIDIARSAWAVVYRLHSSVVPADNPWRGVLKDLKKKSKPAATREEAYALAYMLRDIGEPHLGAAALICFEWHLRPEQVVGGDICWSDWRPANRPDAVHIRHNKTGEEGWVLLEDENGEYLYPEIEKYLMALPRLGTPIVLTVGRRGPARPYSAEYAQRKVREARSSANLPSYVTLDACRHGGLTDLGDSGVTEFEGMAASMHRTPQALRTYVKHSETQRLNAARKRRRRVEANETSARVRIERQKKSQNGKKGDG